MNHFSAEVEQDPRSELSTQVTGNASAAGDTLSVNCFAGFKRSAGSAREPFADRVSASQGVGQSAAGRVNPFRICLREHSASNRGQTRGFGEMCAKSSAKHGDQRGGTGSMPRSYPGRPSGKSIAFVDRVDGTAGGDFF